jgi:hypothetical protein
MFIFSRNFGIFFILSALLLFHGFNNYYILTKSRYCLGLDSQNYLSRVTRTYKIIKEVKLNPKSFFEAYNWIFSDSFKPPLFFLMASPFLLLGLDKNAIVMSNLIYFAILLFSTYGIGNKLYGYKAGLLSAFLVSMFPTVFAMSRIIMIDFALSAMVAATAYLILLNRFDSLKFSLLTGVTIGLGSLTKQSYFLFLLPVLAYFFIQKENLRYKVRLKNFIFAIILGVLILSVYYARVQYNYNHVIFQVKSNEAPFFYLYSLFGRQLLPVLFLFFLVSSAYHFKKKKYFLPVMVLIPLIIFSISANKFERFIMPVFSYIAVLIAGFVWSLPKSKNLAISILVIFSFLQFIAISYGGILPICRDVFKKNDLVFQKVMLPDSGLFSVVDEGDWQGPGEEIVNIIYDVIKNNRGGRKARVVLIVQNWRIESTLRYLLLIEGLDIEIAHSHIDTDFIFRPLEVEIDKNFYEQIAWCDLIIIEKIPPGARWINTEYLFGAFESNFDKFEFIKTTHFPDGTCFIYKNKENVAKSLNNGHLPVF